MNGRHARQSGARRKALGLAVVGVTAGALGLASTGAAVPAEPPKDNVTLCHATGSKTNPYNTITVNKNAVLNAKTGGVKPKGHGNHADDVVPAFTMARKPSAPPGPPWEFAGLNLPEGQGLLANDCYPLAIVKTGDETVLPGGTIKYQVAISNVGMRSIPFKAIQVMDSKVKLDPPVDPPKALDPGQKLVWTGSRMIGDSLVKECGRTIENTAEVTLIRPKKERSRRGSSLRRSNQTDEDTRSRSDSWMTKVICPLDVAIAKSSTQTSVEPGGTVAYTVRVTNPGPIPLPWSFITVADPTATSLTPPVDPPKELKQGEFLDWAATKAVASDIALCGTNIGNTASVTIAPPKPPTNGVKKQSGYEQMPNYTSWPEGPVSASASPVLVSGGICPVTPLTPASVTALRPAAAALTVAKTGPARALAGGRVTYRVTVTNSGSADATGVVLRDQPPGAMALVSKPAGSRMEGTAVLWDIGTIPAGQSVSKSIRFTARRTASGRKCNTAFVVATGVETAQARACTVVVAARRPVTPVTG